MIRGAAHVFFSALALSACTQGSAAVDDDRLAPTTYSIADAQTGAEFREQAGIAINILFWPCQRSVGHGDSMARYQAIKDGLTLDRYAIDLAIAEADFNYYMTLVDLACPNPNAPETVERDTTDIARANGALDSMERALTAPLPAVDPANAARIVYTADDAEAGAQLRADANNIVPILFHPCPKSEAFGPVAARYQGFEAGLTGSHRIDLAVPEADFRLRMTRVRVRCPDPDAPQTARLEEVQIRMINEVLDRIERLSAYQTSVTSGQLGI